MRTDVKIGVAAGLLIVIGFVTYRAVFTDDGTTDANQPKLASKEDGGRGSDKGGGTPEPSGLVMPRFGSGSPNTPAVTPSLPPTPSPGTTEPPTIPSVTETPGVSEVPVPPAVTPSTTEPPVTPSVTPSTTEPPVTPSVTPVVTPTITPSVTPGTTEPPVTPSITPSTTEPPVTPSITPLPTLTPSITPTPSAPLAGGSERTYVVKEGDSGFWAVAEKVYGDGTLWPLISKANPDADSNRLPPGKKLTIPPRPVSRPAVTDGVGEGGLVDVGDGRKHYVVRKGDAGFWAISQHVYGDGKYWTAIAKANPNVNSNNLKPGARLVIPPRPEPATRPIGPVPTITPGPGERLYTVLKTDTAGFWGIAKKVYGNGLYYRVLAAANPSASSSSLKIGQVIRIPELTEEMRRAASRPTTARATPRPKRTDIEDIGPTPSF